MINYQLDRGQSSRQCSIGVNNFEISIESLLIHKIVWCGSNIFTQYVNRYTFNTKFKNNNFRRYLDFNNSEIKTKPFSSYPFLTDSL